MKTLIPFSLLFLLACNQPVTPPVTNPQQPLKAYYYPYPNLKDGLVYEYVNDSTQLPDHYWFLKTVEDEAGNWFLVSTRYNAQFVQDQMVREQIYANGTVCQDYRFFVPDAATNQTNTHIAQITQNTMFAFDIPEKKGQVYRFQILVDLPSYNSSTQKEVVMNYKVTRDRSFAKFDSVLFENKKVAVALFDNLDFMAIKDSLNGGNWTVDSSRVTEHYAQNIGLVQITKQLPSKQIHSVRLKRRLTMDEFLAISQK